jgi:hypothetical protein
VGGRGVCWAATPLKLKLKKKNTDFLDMIVSNVLLDLPFSRNQPMKSADDWYIRILKR